MTQNLNNTFINTSLENLSIIIQNIEKQYSNNPNIQNISLFIVNQISHQITYLKEIFRANKNNPNIKPLPYSGSETLIIEELRTSHKFLCKSNEQFSKLVKTLTDYDEQNQFIKDQGMYLFRFGINIRTIFNSHKQVYVGASDNDPLSKSLVSLREIFTAISSVSEIENSKNLCLIYSVNLIFRIYFSLNTIKTDLFSYLDGNTIPKMELFNPKDLAIQYQFRGSIDIISKKQSRAIDFISKSQSISQNYEYSQFHNLLIEKYLLLMLLKNKYADENILISNNLNIQIELQKQIKLGQLKEQDEWFEKHESQFINRRIYILIISLRLLVFLNLLKRICYEYFEVKQSYQIKLDFITEFLIKLNYGIDQDEILGQMCHLIQTASIRAQISLDHNTIVFDKKMQFDDNVELIKIQ